MPKAQSTSTPCYHCSEPCPTDAIALNGHLFCCNGCSVVYTLISSNGLDSVYANGPLGIKPSDATPEDLDHLDLPEVQRALLDFDDGHLARITFDLPAIHCSSCVYLLERLDKLNPAVKQCQVNFAQKKANILFDKQQLGLKALVQLIGSIGYRPRIALDKVEGQAVKPPIDRTLLYRLGVAGFCFGNIMLLSFPEYLGDSVQMESDMGRFFSYINLALALPVLLYAGADYFSSAWKGMQLRRMNMDVPVAIGMITLFVRSAYDILSGSGAGYLDSLAGFVFFLLIGKWYQAKTYSALSFERDYRSFFPIAVKRTDADGQAQSVMIRDLQVGDIITIRNGELVPADAELLSDSAHIDYSFVTGEAAPVQRHRSQQIYAGGKQLGAVVQLRIVKPVSTSYLTSLWNSMDAKAKDRHNPLIQFSDRVATIFSFNILIVASLTAIYWGNVDPSKWLNAVTSVLIIACPCAIAISIPFTFGSLIRHFGRHGLFVRSASAIDRLGRITDVVFDKTGTITLSTERTVEISGHGLTSVQLEAAVNVARQSLHPLSKAIASAWTDVAILPVSNLHEVAGEGVSGTCGGLRVRLLNPTMLSPARASLFAVWGAGHKVSGKVAVVIEGQLVARLDLLSSYRKGLDAVIHTLKKRFGVYLLSGDNNSEANILSRADVAGFDPNHMHFNMNPYDKDHWVAQHQKDGSKVLMVGDGLNDAGALSQSYFGISVVEDASQFTPASDAILQTDTFVRLPDFIAIARSGRTIVRMAYGISLIYNIVGISVAVQGNLSPVFAAIVMPLSSVSIVIFTTMATTLLVRRRLGRVMEF